MKDRAYSLAEPRRAVPMRLQRDKALELCAELMRKLGMVAVDSKVDFELDHDPALVLRPVDPATGQHIPHQHEPSCLIWRTKEEHDRKTNGPGGEKRITTAGSDKHVAAKTRRLAEQRTTPREPAEEAPAPSFAGRPRPSGFAPAQRKGRASAPLTKWRSPLLERGRS